MQFMKFISPENITSINHRKCSYHQKFAREVLKELSFISMGKKTCSTAWTKDVY